MSTVYIGLDGGGVTLRGPDFFTRIQDLCKTSTVRCDSDRKRASRVR